MMSEAIDSSNQFFVGKRGDGKIMIMRFCMGPLTSDEAVNLAAWLALLADPGEEKFAAVVEAIKRT